MLKITRKDGDEVTLSKAIFPLQRLHQIESMAWHPDNSRMLVVSAKPGYEAALRACFPDDEYDVKEG